MSDTKYRVIADENPPERGRAQAWEPHVRCQVPRYSGWKRGRVDDLVLSKPASDTKYRVIADGNLYIKLNYLIFRRVSDTKYRVIADGVTKQIIRQARCRTWRI